MNACVQSIAYDLGTGRTTLTFGAAGHLGAKDFVERLRVNRGPRWYYEIGGNITNAANGGGQLGNFTPDQGPSPNNAVPSVINFPSSVSDWLANNSAYTQGVPGITHDATGLVDYGGLGAPNAPVMHLALGGSGAITSWAHINGNGTLILQSGSGDGAKTIQIKLADIPGGFVWSTAGPVKFREIAVCVGGVTKYQQILCSEPYTTSLGNT
jgi:hypothetical protein